MNTFKDVSNRIYAIPKREQCGTFKPDDPTSDNTCVCPELDDGTLGGLYYKYSILVSLIAIERGISVGGRFSLKRG